MSPRRSSTACRKLVLSTRITQSITLPPIWQAPRQCQRFVAGVIDKLGSRSSWKGQSPRRFDPCLFSVIPLAVTSRSSEISFFSRSISISGMRAIAVLLGKSRQAESERSEQLRDRSMVNQYVGHSARTTWSP